jgi:hypothetical protein
MTILQFDGWLSDGFGSSEVLRYQGFALWDIAFLGKADVRCGSKAALTAPKSNFRSTPESGLNSDITACPVRAKSGLCTATIRWCSPFRLRAMHVDCQPMVLSMRTPHP